MSLSPRLSDVAIRFEGNVPQILLLQPMRGHAGQCNLSDLIHYFPRDLEENLVMDQVNNVNTGADLSRPEVTKSSSSRSSALRTDSSSWVDFTGALHGQAPQ